MDYVHPLVRLRPQGCWLKRKDRSLFLLLKPLNFTMHRIDNENCTNGNNSAAYVQTCKPVLITES